MKRLPNPKHEAGYPGSQLMKILKKLNINAEKFNEAFGVNTCLISEEGELIFYKCDVEKALYILRHPLGKYHPWD